MAAPVAAPSLEDQADTLDKVLALATTFSTCVEAFGLIHASKPSDRPQKLALAKLGIQQGRLLIVGDVVGISSPPRSIATHMIPSRPGALNPDPNEPVNFGERDARLDDAEIRRQIEAALNEILDRPATLTRAEMMEKFGLKPPKKQSLVTESALDTTRLEAFREKYGLLQDLHGATSLRTRRGMSMTSTHWNVVDVGRFGAFVELVRGQVDALIALLNIQEKVDRGMTIDIKAMGWHPDLNGSIVRRDWEKLNLIAEACKEEYPAYVVSTQVALNYLNRTWKEVYRPPTIAPLAAPVVRVVPPKSQTQSQSQPSTSDENRNEKPHPPARPTTWLRSLFSSGGSSKDKLPKSLSHAQRRRQLSVASPSPSSAADAQRSKSVDVQTTQLFDDDALTQTRSKSLSAGEWETERQQQQQENGDRDQDGEQVPKVQQRSVDPAEPRAWDMAAARPDSPQEIAGGEGEGAYTHIPSSLAETAVAAEEKGVPIPARTTGGDADGGGGGGGSLSRVETVNSLIERRDQFQGLGRTETKQMRELAHGWR